MAPTLEAWFETYEDDGLMVISLMAEDLDSGDVSVEELNAWVDTYGLTHPVVSDPGWRISDRLQQTGSYALPVTHLVGPGVVLLRRDTDLTEAMVRQALP